MYIDFVKPQSSIAGQFVGHANDRLIHDKVFAGAGDCYIIHVWSVQK